MAAACAISGRCTRCGRTRPPFPPQPHITPHRGVLPVPSVQARVLSGACPPLCTTLWTALLHRGADVHSCVHPCGSGVSRRRCSSWFRGKHLAPRGRFSTASAVGAEMLRVPRMPARAYDAIYAAPASADSLPCGVPRETESNGPGTSIPELAVDDLRRRRVRRFRGTGCLASAVPVAPTWNRTVAGTNAESVAVPPSCRLTHRSVSRETLAEVRRPRPSDRSSVTSRDMGRVIGRVPVSRLWSKPR